MMSRQNGFLLILSSKFLSKHKLIKIKELIS